MIDEKAAGRTDRHGAIACHELSRIERVKCQLSLTDERRILYTKAVEYQHSAVTVNHIQHTGRPAGRPAGRRVHPVTCAMLWAYTLQQLL